MDENNRKPMDIEPDFDINDVSFDNVSREFENKFRHRYNSSLNMMSDVSGSDTNTSGVNTLGILEKMAQRMGLIMRFCPK